MSKDDSTQPSTATLDAAAALDAFSYSGSMTDYSEFSPSALQPNIQNWRHLTNLALMCEHFDVSDSTSVSIARII